ncbi:MAG TPA: bifunctional hydroxymethylpyrimidine kinase/phosphomethylpyrimidine kinase [Candidatus Omnitrophota bacterium]|nr:bifunctional hydroxymethylpyrimidine kinase/phosphomethylpyrimidine kinase [Candidatus Omnitrophota bacterium]
MIPTALTIAGSDPSGGAGLQADLKTFHQRRVYGMAVVSLLTVQNTRGVRAVHPLKPAQVISQLETVLEDICPRAAKTGALGNEGLIRAIARKAETFRFPLVIDPVMVSKHGARLLASSSVEALKKSLIPHAALVTPNIPEAEILAGIRIGNLSDMKKASRRILELGPRAVLLKGGHLKGASIDVFCDGKRMVLLKAPRIRTRHTHGTGCTYSAAITAELAKGRELLAAIRIAKRFVTKAIRTAPGLGRGAGPVNHFVKG